MRGPVTAVLMTAVLIPAFVGSALAQNGPANAIVLTKTVGVGFQECGTTDTLTVNPGTPLSYCWRIRNVGSTTLQTHTLIDSEFGALLNPGFFPVPPVESAVLRLVANACVSVTNVATWTAQSSSGQASATDIATLTVNAPNPAVVLTKTVSTGGCPGMDQITVSPGTNVTYCYQVGNTGNVTLTAHMLIDSELGPIAVPQTQLGPGQTTGVSQMQVINMSTTNVATWTSAFTINCETATMELGVGGGHTNVPEVITGTASDTDSAQVIVVTATPTPTPTSTPTQTGTPTGTPTPQENGDPCTTPIQCESMNCVDGVCCDTPCDQPDEVCNLPGQEGTCTEFSLAPALGNLGLAAAAVLLMGIGGFSLALRRRRD